MLLEEVRRREFPRAVSRLTGFYAFRDSRSADLALQWGLNHFQKAQLVELCCDLSRSPAPHDANWITNSRNHVGDRWASSYWAGEPYPYDDAAWEVIVDKRAWILGTYVRQAAYDVVSSRYPDSVDLLEIGRLAAIVGSDLCSVSMFGDFHEQEASFDFRLDMRDAANTQVINSICELIQTGHPVRGEALALLSSGEMIVPDLRAESFNVRIP